MSLETVVNVKGIPIRGGAVTVLDKGLLKPGQFSMVQNVRAGNPGFEKRKGQRKQHSTADSTNQAMSMYQFKKTRISENKYFVEMSDGDVLELTTAPPGVTTGAMGSEAFSGTTAPKPASWSNLNDILFYSTGVDQHTLYPGATSYPTKFILYTAGAAALNTLEGILEDGFDYTDEVTDGQSSTVATVSSMDDIDAGDGIYICTPVPAKSFTLTFVTVNTGADPDLAVYYWKNDCSWATVSDLVDGTASGGVMFGQSGTITFTAPSDIQERYLFGQMGYWYILVSTADALDAGVTISAVTYDAPWSSMVSMWDGAPVLSPAVLVEGTSNYDFYSGSNVNLDTLAAGKKIYIASGDPIEGIYVDVMDTPNATGTSITSLKYWDGDSWVALTVAADGTSGLSNTGWILFNRATAHPRMMESNKLYVYWYELILSAELAADMVVAIYTMPYYDIHDWGYYGQCNCAWKERMLYSWADRYQEYVYISSTNGPQIIAGTDTAIIEVGDGRPHKIVAMKNFFNNVLVWQEEKGEIGGCVTMLQGYDVPTFGKLVLSTKLGTMNAKSVDVVENVYTATATDEELKTVAFFISRYGVVACDGSSFAIISDDIQNYFDPSETSTCIRRGYEDQMWLKHDPLDHVLRLGLVCGGSATTPNIFPVYDLISRQWYFDVRAQELSFWDNVEAGSGDVPIVQLGGGVDDGTLYQVNYGTADVSTAIDTYVRVEFPGYGQYIDLLQFMLTCVAQTGNITFTTYQNNIEKDSLTLSMAAEYSTQEIRRHLLSLNVIDQQVAVKIQNSSTTESMTLMAVGAEMKVWQNR